nr:YvrJ family protein [Schinkia azotoformans]
MITLIGNMGFPIAISIYLLHRFENKIESLENAIVQLAEVVKQKKE